MPIIGERSKDMKLKELMQDNTPNINFEGITTADDFVLAVDFSESATTEGDYVVAQEGMTELSGELETITQESQYLRGGKQTVKTGTQRSFTLTGERFIGDEFQDAIMAHNMKYGTGQSVIRPYVYFNILTGVGEKGSISIAVESDPSGAAGENAGISATLTARGTPVEFVYS